MTARGGRPPRACGVPGCRRPHYGRGYCRTHWTRWHRHGDPDVSVRREQLCEVEGCGRRHSGRGLCAAHLARLTRHGDAQAHIPVGRRAHPTGDQGGGRGMSYWVAHRRVAVARGPARAQRCADCGAAARCWSYDGTDPDECTEPGRGIRYSLDVDRYRPRCWSCHRRPGQPHHIPVPASVNAVGPRTPRPPRLCEVPGCRRRHLGRGYCRAHLSRLARFGDVRADVPIEHHTRDGVSYWSVHHRLSVQRGRATERRCADCGAVAGCWSYDGTDPDERTSAAGYRYSPDLNRYQPRCRPCHRRATIVRTAPRAVAAVQDVEHAVWLYERGVSAPGIAAVMGVSRTAVYSALRAQGVTIRPRGTRAAPAQPLTAAVQT